jgi:hypothetical protein
MKVQQQTLTCCGRYKHDRPLSGASENWLVTQHVGDENNAELHDFLQGETLTFVFASQEGSRLHCPLFRDGSDLKLRVLHGFGRA